MKNISVLGVDSLIGAEIVKILEQRNFPSKEIFFYAPETALTKTINFKDRDIEVLSDYALFINKVDLAFCCLNKVQARQAISQFSKKAVVVDNSGVCNLNLDIPLVIPQINPEKIKEDNRIIATPNSLTIQLLAPLHPLHKIFHMKRIFVATYQSVSEHGKDAIDELKLEYEYLAMNQHIEKSERSVYPYAIGNNVIPQSGNFGDNRYTEEENSLVDETAKILGTEAVLISPTFVWVSVFMGHSMVVQVEFENPISLQDAKEILQNVPNIKLMEKGDYPMPFNTVGKNEIFIGRLRKDLSFENGLSMWIVTDNIRRSALNSVQIAESLLYQK